MSESSHQPHASQLQDNILQAIARAFSTVGGGFSLALASIASCIAALGVSSLLSLMLLCHFTSSPLTTSASLFFDYSHHSAIATLDLSDLYSPYSPHPTSSYWSWIGTVKETLFPKLPDILNTINEDQKEESASNDDDNESSDLHPNVIQAIRFQQEHERHIKKALLRPRDLPTLSIGQEFRLMIKLSVPSRAKRNKPILIVQATCELMSASGQIIDRSTRQSLITSDKTPPHPSIIALLWVHTFWMPCKVTGSSSSFFCADNQASFTTQLLLFETFIPVTSTSSVRAVRVILGPSSTHRWVNQDGQADGGGGGMSGLVTAVDEALLILEPKRGWLMRGLYSLRGQTTLIVLWGLFSISLTLFGVLAVILLLFLAIGLLKFAGNQRAVDEDQQFVSAADAYEMDGDREGSEAEGMRESMEEEQMKGPAPVLLLQQPMSRLDRQESLQMPPSSTRPFFPLIEEMERRAATQPHHTDHSA